MTDSSGDTISPEVSAPSAFERIPRGVRWAIALLATIALAIALAAFHSASWHWFEVHSGTVNESGPYYGFWSGFGSDLGEATLVAGVVAAWRHHNCHVKGCSRLGRPVEGTPYVACARHHPAHTGSKRAISHELLHSEFHASESQKNSTARANPASSQ